MKKKITRISAIVLLVLAALLIALPHLMEKKLGEVLKENVNTSIHGDFDFSSVELSIYRNFPNARITLDQVSLANAAPFEGDTLFSASRIEMQVGIVELFQGANDPIEINEIRIENVRSSLIINAEEESNFDIARVNEKDVDEAKTDSSTIFSVNSYEISNAELVYRDESSNYTITVHKMNHRGSGDLSEVISDLETYTEAVISFEMDGTRYVDQNSLQLEADLNIDLKNNRYTFKDNKAIINRLPITFKGFVELQDDQQEIDLSFNTITSDFKNFLALIPEKYSKDISNLKTSGNFDISGSFEGILSEQSIPQFEIAFSATNASFKYPDLPKRVEQIQLDSRIANSTGKKEDIAVYVDNLSFKIDEDIFQLKTVISNLMGNTRVESVAKGRVDLDNLSQAYPVSDAAALSGKLTTEIEAKFSVEDIEKKKFGKIALEGMLLVEGLNYSYEALPHPLRVHRFEAELGPKTIVVNEIAGITGSTDFSANGSLYNTLGYIFNEEVLRGKFEMRSNSFVVADLIPEEKRQESEQTDEEEGSFDIPTYLDLRLDALVGKAVYDKIVLYDLIGSLRIKDEVITFNQISSRVFDGRLVFNGNLSTKEEKPAFQMGLDMSKLDIGSTFESVELMGMLSPAAKAMNGQINSKMSFSGNLTDQLDLDLNSLSGNVLTEILTAQIQPGNTAVTELLDTRLGFVKFDQLDLSGLKTAFSFEDGQVKVKPFALKYEDIEIQISGGHSFANALNYKFNLNVPARYLGDDVNKLLAGIGDDSLEEISIPVVANLGGTYNNPKLGTDLKEQTKELTVELVEIQKQKYIKKGKAQVGELIKGALAGSNDSGSSNKVAEEGQGTEIINQSIPKITDSLNSVTEKESGEENLKKAAKNILGGLLNSKKVTAKDTLN